MSSSWFSWSSDATKTSVRQQQQQQQEKEEYELQHDNAGGSATSDLAEPAQHVTENDSHDTQGTATASLDATVDGDEGRRKPTSQWSEDDCEKHSRRPCQPDAESLIDEMDDVRSELTRFKTDVRSKLRQEVAAVEARARKDLLSMEQQVRAALTGLHQQISSMKAELKQGAADATQKVCQKVKSEMTARLDTSVQEIDSTLKQITRDVDELGSRVNATDQEVKKCSEGMEAKQLTYMAKLENINSRVAKQSEDNTKLQQEADKKLDTELQRVTDCITFETACRKSLAEQLKDQVSCSERELKQEHRKLKASLDENKTDMEGKLAQMKEVIRRDIDTTQDATVHEIEMLGKNMLRKEEAQKSREDLQRQIKESTSQIRKEVIDRSEKEQQDVKCQIDKKAAELKAEMHTQFEQVNASLKEVDAAVQGKMEHQLEEANSAMRRDMEDRFEKSSQQIEEGRKAVEQQVEQQMTDLQTSEKQLEQDLKQRIAAVQGKMEHQLEEANSAMRRDMDTRFEKTSQQVEAGRKAVAQLVEEEMTRLRTTEKQLEENMKQQLERMSQEVEAGRMAVEQCVVEEMTNWRTTERQLEEDLKREISAVLAKMEQLEDGTATKASFDDTCAAATNQTERVLQEIATAQKDMERRLQSHVVQFQKKQEQSLLQQESILALEQDFHSSNDVLCGKVEDLQMQISDLRRLLDKMRKSLPAVRAANERDRRNAEQYFREQQQRKEQAAVEPRRTDTPQDDYNSDAVSASTWQSTRDADDAM